MPFGLLYTARDRQGHGAIFEADTLADVKEPVCTLLVAWHSSGQSKQSMDDKIREGVDHIATVVAEVFPDEEWLPLEEDEF